MHHLITYLYLIGLCCRLTDAHKSAIRVMRRIRYFVAKRKFQVCFESFLRNRPKAYLSDGWRYFSVYRLILLHFGEFATFSCVYFNVLLLMCYCSEHTLSLWVESKRWNNSRSFDWFLFTVTSQGWRGHGKILFAALLPVRMVNQVPFTNLD